MAQSELGIIYSSGERLGMHLSLEAYKYEENNIYVLSIMQHKEQVKFYTETQILYLYNFSRWEVMAYKRKWRCSPIHSLSEVIANVFCNQGCKVAEF